MQSNLSELFRMARNYGLVYLHTHDDGTYSCTVKFSTINHVELKAESGFKHKEPENAVLAAIKKAIEIVESLKEPKEHKVVKTFMSRLIK